MMFTLTYVAGAGLLPCPCSLFCLVAIMSNTRSWNIHVCNVRGIDTQAQWDAIRNKIVESASTIICLKETERDFDQFYLRFFCHQHLVVLSFPHELHTLVPLEDLSSFGIV